MKGDKFLKAVVITLCLVVASYLIFSLTRFSGDSFSTYKAVRYEVGDGITTSGLLVRSEQAVRADTQGILVLTRAEGEKVGKGQTLAATYQDETARDRQAQIDRMQAELRQMKSAYSFSASDLESATLDTDINRLMNRITVSAARREFTAAEKSAEEIKPYVLRRYITGTDAETLWVRITALEEQLNELYAQAQAGIGSVSAPVSGWFSAESDGLEERLTPAFLENCYISDLEEAQAAAGQDSGALCKLVTAQKWYFAAIVPAQNVRDLKEGSRVQVSFAYDFDAPLRMKVERISSPEEERCILVLSSEACIQNAVSSRIQTADLVFADRVGLRVPKTALYVNEAGERGVYVLEGAEAQWKEIELLYDNGDSYIVQLDKSSTKNLWPEDEIILTTEDIYDGKVMIK